MIKRWIWILSIILIFLVVVNFNFKPIYVPPPESQLGNGLPGLASLGNIDHSFNILLGQIKEDLGRKDLDIKIVIGPYFPHDRILGVLDTRFEPHYFILIDKKFREELTTEETGALIAHEMGHELFRIRPYMDHRQVTEVQKKADRFATKYFHPDHVSSMLDKVFAEYSERKKNIKSLTSH